jgi:hypothetical protein
MSYLNTTYEKGTYKRQCPVCGFWFKRSEMRRRWDDLIVDDECWETKPDNLRKREKPREKPFKRE